MELECSLCGFKKKCSSNIPIDDKLHYDDDDDDEDITPRDAQSH